MTFENQGWYMIPFRINDYEKYTNPNWIVNKDNNIENKDKSNQKSKFIL